MKTIYDLTQDELDFMQAHIEALKKRMAVQHNLILMLQEENNFLKEEVDDYKKRYK